MTKFAPSLVTAPAAVALLSLPTAAGAATAPQPVEGYRSPDGRVGCVLFQDYDSHGNAVACGRRTGTRGVLLTGSGAAKAAAWTWPADRLGSDFFTARWDRTLYLSGGTAKTTGSSTTLRCVFRSPAGVQCLNRSGVGLAITSTTIGTITPLTS